MSKVSTHWTQPHSSPSVPSATALPCDASATRDCQGAQIASTFGVLGQWSLDLLQWRGLKTSRIHEHHKLRESAVNNKTWAPRCPNWCLHNQTYLNNISEREVHVWDIIEVVSNLTLKNTMTAQEVDEKQLAGRGPVWWCPMMKSKPVSPQESSFTLRRNTCNAVHPISHWKGRSARPTGASKQMFRQGVSW